MYSPLVAVATVPLHAQGGVCLNDIEVVRRVGCVVRELHSTTRTEFNPSSQILFDALNVMCCCQDLGVRQAGAAMLVSTRVRDKFNNGGYTRDYLKTLAPAGRKSRFWLLVLLATALGALNWYMYMDRNYWRYGRSLLDADTPPTEE